MSLTEQLLTRVIRDSIPLKNPISLYLGGLGKASPSLFYEVLEAAPGYKTDILTSLLLETMPDRALHRVLVLFDRPFPDVWLAIVRSMTVLAAEFDIGCCERVLGNDPSLVRDFQQGRVCDVLMADAESYMRSRDPANGSDADLVIFFDMPSSIAAFADRSTLATRSKVSRYAQAGSIALMERQDADMAEPLVRYLDEAGERAPNWLRSLARDAHQIEPRPLMHHKPVLNRFTALARDCESE